MKVCSSLSGEFRSRTGGRRAGQRFDAEHRVTTEALVFLGDLTPELAGPHVQYATHYEPTPVADFEAFMCGVAIDWPTTTFVDVGSGMGRVVLLASRRPFKQIIGVELSPALHEVALENRKTWVDARQGCTDVRFVRGDVCTFSLPPGNLLLYLYNPFQRPVLKALLERVLAERQSSREIVLCYHLNAGRKLTHFVRESPV